MNENQFKKLLSGLSFVYLAGALGCEPTKNLALEQEPLIISGRVNAEHFHGKRGFFSSSISYEMSMLTDNEQIIMFDGFLEEESLDSLLDKGDSVKIHLRQKRYGFGYFLSLRDVVEVNGAKNPLYRE